jgi:hypothetical protein
MECFSTIFQVDLQRAAFPPETSDQRNETAVVLGESSFHNNLYNKRVVQPKMSLSLRKFLIWKERVAGRQVSRQAYLRLG